MTRTHVYEPPKTDLGRWLAAQVFDRLVAASHQPVSPALREAFLAAFSDEADLEIPDDEEPLPENDGREP